MDAGMTQNQSQTKIKSFKQAIDVSILKNATSYFLFEIQIFTIKQG